MVGGRDHWLDRISDELEGSTDRAAPVARQGDGARACPPPGAPSPEDLGPPVVASCVLGQVPSGRVWDTVRWAGNSTLLVGPGVTLTLGEGDVDAIHAALGRVIEAREGRA